MNGTKKTLLAVFVLLCFNATMVFATANHFVHAGKCMGVHHERDYLTTFKARPEVHALTWNLMDLEQAHPGIRFKHLLWSSMFLKTYAKEAVLANIAGVCRATYRKWSWIVIKRIAALRSNVISLGNRFRRDKGRTCKMTIDCTDCKLWEPIPFSKTWFTFKHKCAGFRYEVGVCIQTGDICWINGPFKCGVWNDLMIFRRNLKHRLRPGEMVETDGGYSDPSCRNKHAARTWDDLYAKADARARHECVNGDIKSFGCLEQRWRHPRGLHKYAFAACAVLTQLGYNLKGGGPYPVNY